MTPKKKDNILFTAFIISVLIHIFVILPVVSVRPQPQEKTVTFDLRFVSAVPKPQSRKPSVETVKKPAAPKPPPAKKEIAVKKPVVAKEPASPPPKPPPSPEPAPRETPAPPPVVIEEIPAEPAPPEEEIGTEEEDASSADGDSADSNSDSDAGADGGTGEPGGEDPPSGEPAPGETQEAKLPDFSDLESGTRISLYPPLPLKTESMRAEDVLNEYEELHQEGLGESAKARALVVEIKFRLDGSGIPGDAVFVTASGYENLDKDLLKFLEITRYDEPEGEYYLNFILVPAENPSAPAAP